MEIDFEGRTWQLDLDEISLRQGVQVQAHTGLTLRKWEASLLDDDHPQFLQSYQAVYWVMLGQNGETPPPVGDTDFKVIRFFEAVIAGLEAAMKEAGAAEDAAPDPTRPAPASAPSPAPSSRKRKTAAASGGSPDG